MEPFTVPIDHDPSGQDLAIRRIVNILYASRPDMSQQHVAKRSIVAALDGYKASVVQLVLDGSLNHSQGQELADIVDNIAREAAEETSPPWPR